MKKQLSIFIILIIIFLTASCSNNTNNYTKYSQEFWGTFDTTVQIIGYTKNKDDFENMVDIGEDRLMQLNKIFDIYNNYENLNNAKTINDNAGIKPVKVPQEMIGLLLLSKQWYRTTNGKCNVALGPVLKIWHHYRDEAKNNPENAKIPTLTELSEAINYTDIEKVIIDAENSTVFLKEKNMSLDLGAVAKGFACDLLAKELVEKGYTSFIISIGGNVKVAGAPLNNTRSKWGIGLTNPFASSDVQNEPYVDVIYLNSGSVVTSGDYQRYYTVDGQNYHHIISPDTMMPANYFKSVSIVTEESGFADFMSTTLFLTPYDEGLLLAEEFDIGAIWIMHDGTIKSTDNARIIMKELGGATNN